MGLSASWLADNWFSFLESLGICAALLFNAIALRRDANVRKVEFLSNHTRDHRDIWQQLYSKPELARVLETTPELGSMPVTSEETLFVNLIILHLSATLAAVRAGVMPLPPGAEHDVRTFFSLPIPNHVWNTTRQYREKELLEMVDRLISRKDHPGN